MTFCITLSTIPSGHENYFPWLHPHYQIELAWSLKQRVMGTFAAITACLSIYLFIGNLLKPLQFVTELWYPLLCIAANPGVVCGQSVLPGVDGRLQAGEVGL